VSGLGPPRFTNNPARLCLVGAVGHPPLICALSPDSDGDLRAVLVTAYPERWSDAEGEVPL
jgi:hypothetical protein